MKLRPCPRLWGRAKSGDNLSKLLGDLYTEYLTRNKKAGLEPISITGIKSKEGRFAVRRSGIQLHAITPDMVEAWVNEYDIEPRSRNSYVKAASALAIFFTACIFDLRNPVS